MAHAKRDGPVTGTSPAPGEWYIDGSGRVHRVLAVDPETITYADVYRAQGAAEGRMMVRRVTSRIGWEVEMAAGQLIRLAAAPTS